MIFDQYPAEQVAWEILFLASPESCGACGIAWTAGVISIIMQNYVWDLCQAKFRGVFLTEAELKVMARAQNRRHKIETPFSDR